MPIVTTCCGTNVNSLQTEVVWNYWKINVKMKPPSKTFTDAIRIVEKFFFTIYVKLTKDLLISHNFINIFDTIIISNFIWSLPLMYGANTSSNWFIIIFCGGPNVVCNFLAKMEYRYGFNQEDVKFIKKYKRMKNVSGLSPFKSRYFFWKVLQ